MDLTYSTAVAPVLLPIGASALVLSRIIDGKEALFSHERLGQNGDTLQVYKIRTLKGIGPNVPGIGTYNPHATWFGKKLRPTGVDEIPQLINIFRGKMSVVGPRVIYEDVFRIMEDILDRNLYDEWSESYYLSKPGMISSASIQNRTGNLPLEQQLGRKAKLDLEDFYSASFRYDNYLLRQAGSTILRLASRGSYTAPSASTDS